MSISFTYNSLTATIQDWSADDDEEFVAEIPTFISLAESRILGDLDLAIFEQDLGLSVSAGSRSVTKPTDTIYVNEVWVRNAGDMKWRPVVKRSFGFCRYFAPNESEQDTPEYFAEEEDTIVLVPTPAATYTTSNAKARCTIRPTGLSSGNSTTWISEHLGNLLLEACKIEAYDYLKHPAKLQEAASKYQSLLPGISTELDETIRRKYKGLAGREGADE